MHTMLNQFQVKIYAVITGHGSDENGCGEFCVTSHHFVVNKHINNITFSEAGKTKQLHTFGPGYDKR